MTQQYHPLFVYGTLLSGESAYPLLAPHIEKTLPATLPDAALLNLGAYPMVVDGDDDVAGEICWLQADKYEQTLQQLDRYEGPDYARQLRSITVQDASEDIQAWVYVGTSIPSACVPLSTGDWRKR